MRDQRSRRRLNDRAAAVLAGESADRTEAVDAGERDKRDLTVLVAAKHVRIPESRDIAHRSEELGEQEALVSASFLPPTCSTGFATIPLSEHDATPLRVSLQILVLA